MSYANGHPVRLAGGRLALDFVNTADWTEDGRVAHEKIDTPADLQVWLAAVGLGAVRTPDDIAATQLFRQEIRALLRGGGDHQTLLAATQLDIGAARSPAAIAAQQPLEALIAISTVSILTDNRELARLKTCPGKDCGWLFIDETKNARRRWCVMETCGNRAKAARHYARRTRQDGVATSDGRPFDDET